MTGIELIAKERQEQIEKHGYTVERDADYEGAQLLGFANAILNRSIRFYPLDWDKHYFDKVMLKDRKGQLIIVGALIAAELDRLNALKL